MCKVTCRARPNAECILRVPPNPSNAEYFGMRWQPKGDTALVSGGPEQDEPKRRRRSALPAHCKMLNRETYPCQPTLRSGKCKTRPSKTIICALMARAGLGLP